MPLSSFFAGSGLPNRNCLDTDALQAILGKAVKNEATWARRAKEMRTANFIAVFERCTFTAEQLYYMTVHRHGESTLQSNGREIHQADFARTHPKILEVQIQWIWNYNLESKTIICKKSISFPHWTTTWWLLSRSKPSLFIVCRSKKRFSSQYLKVLS